MNVVGYGGGTNSTAMLIGLWQRRIPVDLIPVSYTHLDVYKRQDEDSTAE